MDGCSCVVECPHHLGPTPTHRTHNPNPNTAALLAGGRARVRLLGGAGQGRGAQDEGRRGLLQGRSVCMRAEACMGLGRGNVPDLVLSIQSRPRHQPPNSARTSSSSCWPRPRRRRRRRRPRRRRAAVRTCRTRRDRHGQRDPALPLPSLTNHPPHPSKQTKQARPPHPPAPARPRRTSRISPRFWRSCARRSRRRRRRSSERLPSRGASLPSKCVG